MSFDEDLAAGVRTALARAGAVHEIRMFGGIGFMLNGNLVVAASRRGLLARVGKDQQRAALARPGARAMVMRGRVMEGYVYVDPPALADRAAVKPWVQLALAFVRTLPPKPAASKKATKKKTAKKKTAKKKAAKKKSRAKSNLK